jgi:hypothetical protein
MRLPVDGDQQRGAVTLDADFDRKCRRRRLTERE